MGRRVRDSVDELERGRETSARRAWLESYESLTAAHEDSSLAAPDLELLAQATYMLGRDDESIGVARSRLIRSISMAGRRCAEPTVRCGSA